MCNPLCGYSDEQGMKIKGRGASNTFVSNSSTVWSDLTKKYDHIKKYLKTCLKQ